MFLLPKTMIERMEKIRRKFFFWQGLKRKYHPMKWENVCKAKKKGGMRIKNLRLMNISLLCKWWWELQAGEGLWQEIVRLKYVKLSLIYLIPNRVHDSPLWKDLLKVRYIYLKGRGYKVNNEKMLVFGWTNAWVTNPSV
jgi:hypothetical protein